MSVALCPLRELLTKRLEMFSEPKETASAAPDQTPPGARGGEPPLQVKKKKSI